MSRSRPLVSFAPGVWLDSAPVRIVAMRLTATMAVLDLGDGALLLYSPLQATPERRSAVEMHESVLLHRPSATLVVADLVHNVGRPRGWWTGIYTRSMGFYDRVAISRMLRWLGFSDRAATRRSLEAVLAWPFERLVVGHGDPIDREAHEALAQAYAWLPGA